ncbi:MAG: flagellar hook assembly protein FlgD [Massilia sp.]
MSITSVSGTTAVDPASGNQLNQQDFIKILMTQLTYQDPLKPMDNEQFMAQMAQFTALQQTTELNTNLLQLIQNQAALASVGLIGRTVDVQTASGTQTGTVAALSYTGDQPVISVKVGSGQTIDNISLSQLVNVR